MSNRATIEDVAAAAQVSRAAVSKVLRNAHGVSASMRSRVETAIDDLGYRPRLAARAMRGSTNTIGVVVNHLSNQFLSEVLEGGMSALTESHYQVIIAPTDPSRSDGREAIEALYDRQVDGIVAVAPLAAADWLDIFAKRVPMVVIGRHDESDRYDSVVGDDVAGAELAVRHLIERGHTSIAHLTHVDPHVLSDLNTPHGIRRETYERVMREAGLKDQISIIMARFEEEPAYTSTRKYLSDGHRPTAIFAGNDDAAFGVLRAANDEGLDFEDLAVVGYDNSRTAAHPRLGLTSIDQRGGEMGRRAFELLHERIGGRTTPKRVTTPAELFARQSTASQPTPNQENRA